VTTTATGLGLEIQKLKNTIATRKKENLNPHNPELLLLNKLCDQKKKELIIETLHLVHKDTTNIDMPLATIY